MNTFAIVALAWIPVAAGLVVGFAFFLGWLEDRSERRRTGRAAE